MDAVLLKYLLVINLVKFIKYGLQFLFGWGDVNGCGLVQIVGDGIPKELVGEEVITCPEQVSGRFGLSISGEDSFSVAHNSRNF